MMGFPSTSAEPMRHRLRRGGTWGVPALLGCAGLLGLAGWAWAAGAAAGETFMAPGGLPGGYPWWVWPLGLFLFAALLGVVTVLAGIGGAVVFVPFVSGFVPELHLDFVRGAGLMIALAGALAAGPALLRKHLVDLRLAIPISLSASVGSILGAQWGLTLPVRQVELALGVTILAVAALMVAVRAPVAPQAPMPDRLARLLRIEGKFWDDASRTWSVWQPRRMVAGLLLFSGVGVIGGLFGLGAGWANIPVLNLVMGVPLKSAVATSYFLLAASGSTAAWVYLHRGALLPLIVIPAVLGVMLGSRLGARLLLRTPAGLVRWLVVVALVLSGVRAVLRGISP
jgi:hypothetical protein